MSVDNWEADVSDSGGVLWVSGQNKLVFSMGNGGALRYRERFLRCQNSFEECMPGSFIPVIESFN